LKKYSGTKKRFFYSSKFVFQQEDFSVTKSSIKTESFFRAKLEAVAFTFNKEEAQVEPRKFFLKQRLSIEL
jgi:hypothetical protein